MSPKAISSDLTFLTNEPGNALLDRFRALLGKNTRLFDCLVGYFFISGFYKLYPSLEHTEKVRILIGLKTDAMVFQSLERAKNNQHLPDLLGCLRGGLRTNKIVSAVRGDAIFSWCG